VQDDKEKTKTRFRIKSGMTEKIKIQDSSVATLRQNGCFFVTLERIVRSFPWHALHQVGLSFCHPEVSLLRVSFFVPLSMFILKAKKDEMLKQVQHDEIRDASVATLHQNDRPFVALRSFYNS